MITVITHVYLNVCFSVHQLKSPSWVFNPFVSLSLLQITVLSAALKSLAYAFLGCLKMHNIRDLQPYFYFQ